MLSTISYLRVLLAGLPSTLPYKSGAESTYKFQDFGISDEEIEDLGLAGALNHELEVRLGDRTKRGDTFEIKERGPGIEALAEVLQHYQEMLPEDVLLSKWISDACRAAELLYKDAGIPLTEDEARASTPSSRGVSASQNLKKRNRRAVQSKREAGKRPDTKVLESFDDPRYTDIDEVKDMRAGGGKMEPLLPKVSRLLVLEPSKVRNLTLSFDGGKLRHPRGIYTVTVTTPSDRKSFIINLNDASRVSHTARYITHEILKPVFNEIPAENFSAVVSDNTGNTREARQFLTQMFPHLLNFQDCCHEMNLALLQINGLDEFREQLFSSPVWLTYPIQMIQDVKDILSYMHHSTYAMEHYNDIRKNLRIQTGLAQIAQTRFWTYVAAVDSIYQGLPAFRELLMQYLAVTTPFARAIKCLESATATAADVYAYWLAIMSRLEHIMTDSTRIKLRTETMEDIRAIANQRFNELLEDGPEDVYLAAFFLDPLTQQPTLLERAKNPETARDKLITHIGICLQGILLREYGGKDMVDRDDIQELMNTRNPLLAPFGPLDAYERLRKELYAYADQESPFSRVLKPEQTVLQWWRKVQRDEDAQVLGALAIKIFSVVPHSMADERLMSVITWLNGPRRAAQQVHTVANHVKIHQFYINKVCPHIVFVESL
ncbi:ribonuclease H-like domain-containing protein [Trametes punicea]|nr:ribonuclease H-like domain-containing protein [Trametes punicea]